jgi:hypothetical protein
VNLLQTLPQKKKSQGISSIRKSASWTWGKKFMKRRKQTTHKAGEQVGDWEEKQQKKMTYWEPKRWRI